MTANDLDQDIEEYSEWIKKKIPISEGWIDEINYISFIRDDIHRGIKDEADTALREKLRLLDREWQDQIIATIDKEFQYTDRLPGNYPNDLWWWHIDRLSELTEAERSTL